MAQRFDLKHCKATSLKKPKKTRHIDAAFFSKLLSTVANQAAVAIQNTKLISETITMREALETRKIVERAKGILMREKQITEEEAYRRIQQKSMKVRKSMREIAEAIILTAEIKG